MKEHNPKTAKQSKPVFLAGALLAVGLIAGFASGYFLRPKSPANATVAIRENTAQYKFIDPLLAVSRSDMSTPSPQAAPLAKSVNAFIASQTQNGTLIGASVYFASYGKNGSFAINQNAPYDPASMLKVVIMVAYLKESETDSALLNQQLTYNAAIQEVAESIPFQDPTHLAVGATYSIAELINKMIIDSDNGAMDLLLNHMDSGYLNQIYSDLGLQTPQTAATYTISANDYSLFFRVLYNATYLDAANSEKALSILSQATFANGLVAGLPAGTVVAHKFGERINGSGDRIDSVELHDCGIVYYSHNPYILCVMTKGKDLKTLSSTISGISKIVYNNIAGKS